MLSNLCHAKLKQIEDLGVKKILIYLKKYKK